MVLTKRSAASGDENGADQKNCVKLRRKDAHCTMSMRNSTGSPLFSDFKSDLSRVVRFRPLVKGNEDPGYEGVQYWGMTLSSVINRVSLGLTQYLGPLYNPTT